MGIHKVSRRHFFYGSLLAGAIPAGGFGSVTSLKRLGYKPFNEKLNIAAIGAGGRAEINIPICEGENIVALCDVDSDRAAAMFKRFPKAPKYRDFRVMLDKEEKNIDAVLITIPDHMHAIAALACMKMGKGVYVEKPLTRTPWEAHLLYEAAAKYKVATQMGNQGFSFENHRVACEILWSGEIGNVTEVHVSTMTPVQSFWPQGLKQLSAEESVPAGLDWNLWLGGATMRPYRRDIAPFNWRGYFDFGTGPLGDWGIHSFGPAHLALQLTAPLSVEVIKQEGKSNWTFPSRSVLRYDFPARGNMPPVKIYWYDAATNDNPWLYHPAGMEHETILPSKNSLVDYGRGPSPVSGGVIPPALATRLAAKPGLLSGNGAVFVGDKGMMVTTREDVHLLPSERWKGYKLPPQLLTRSPGSDLVGHFQDWIRACKGGDPGCSNFGISAPYAEWVTLGAIAYHFEGKLEYDAAKQRFTNVPEANAYLKPVYREGWEPVL